MRGRSAAPREAEREPLVAYGPASTNERASYHSVRGSGVCRAGREPDTSAGPLTTKAKAAAASRRPGHQTRYPLLVMRDCQLKGPAVTSRFPAVFRLPAFASRPSDSRRGVGPSLRSAYRALPPGPRRGLPRFARTSCDRGGCLLCPEDGGALPGWAGFPADACRIAAASPYAPLQPPIGGADRNETSVGGLGSSPVRSASRLWPPDGTGALGLLPDASNPAGDASDARQAEARPRARAWNYAFDLRRTSNQRVHSYACDLASQSRPIFPSPVTPGCNGSVLGFTPSFAPRPCGRRTSKWGQVIEHGPETTLYVIDLASNPALFSQCVRPRVARDEAVVPPWTFGSLP